MIEWSANVISREGVEGKERNHTTTPRTRAGKAVALPKATNHQTGSLHNDLVVLVKFPAMT
jgi:hypothetical protein